MLLYTNHYVLEQRVSAANDEHLLMTFAAHSCIPPRDMQKQCISVEGFDMVLVPKANNIQDPVTV